MTFFRCCDVINDETRVRYRARSGESWKIKAVALAVLVDSQVLCHAQASSAQICVGKSHTTSLLGYSEVVARETAARPCGG